MAGPEGAAVAEQRAAALALEHPGLGPTLDLSPVGLSERGQPASANGVHQGPATALTTFPATFWQVAAGRRPPPA